MRRSLVKRRLALIELFGGACARCNYNRCANALHFHHRDSREKRMWSGASPGRTSFTEVELHPERFELLCANCHIEHHTAEREATEKPLATCLNCGTVFVTERSVLSKGHGRYCSIPCTNAHRTVLAQSSLADRFWPKVEKRQYCWRWTGYSHRGSGMLMLTNPDGSHTTITAKAAAYRLYYGIDTTGGRVQNTCSNRGCVNPKHLSFIKAPPRHSRRKSH